MFFPTINMKPKKEQRLITRDKKPENLRYSCRVFYPALRSNRECG